MRVKTRKADNQNTFAGDNTNTEKLFGFQWLPAFESFHKASHFYEIFPVQLFSRQGVHERCTHQTCDPGRRICTDIISTFHLDVKETLAILDYSSFNKINSWAFTNGVCHIHFRDATRTVIDGVNWKNDDVPKFIRGAVKVFYDFRPQTGLFSEKSHFVSGFPDS